jgi:hypothetical protein
VDAFRSVGYRDAVSWEKQAFLSNEVAMAWKHLRSFAMVAALAVLIQACKDQAGFSSSPSPGPGAVTPSAPPQNSPSANSQGPALQNNNNLGASSSSGTASLCKCANGQQFYTFDNNGIAICVPAGSRPIGTGATCTPSGTICGCNNVTYKGSCAAFADGVYSFTDGSCSG